MQFLRDIMFVEAARDGRITAAEVAQEIEDMGLETDPVHRRTEQELWAVREMYDDVFETDALAAYDQVLTDRLQEYHRQGPGLMSRLGGFLGWEANSDGDALSDRQEKRLGTNPFLSDTDGDGWTDDREVERGSDPGRAY